jgi:hypothetical protein
MAWSNWGGNFKQCGIFLENTPINKTVTPFRRPLKLRTELTMKLTVERRATPTAPSVHVTLRPSETIEWE